MNCLNNIKIGPKDRHLDGDETGGVWFLRSPVDRKRLSVIASIDHGWDHVSVSRKERVPNWEEMEYVKRLFFRAEEIAMQLHVPPSAHINHHNFCLHLWRPQMQKIPMPPRFLV